MEDFPLPALAPNLVITRAPESAGEPVWTIHNPAANTYFKIDWAAFECIARFSTHKTAAQLQGTVERETTLSVTMEHIADIVGFLQQNGLVSLYDQKVTHRPAKAAPLWKKALHTYLYVPVPLFQPQTFLEKVYPKIRLLFDRKFVTGMMLVLLGMIIVTLPRIDEFLHTFHTFFSLEGAAATLIVLSFVKIVHEFAHAFTAVRYGVRVPHMGVAFIVMYPVLYTETTGSWALSSRKARFHIAVAGVVAELCLAAIFLALWHVLPAGSIGQMACFLVVCVSLVSSLLVNLNPLMRFDGYYMLSDATGFDNLQGRSIAHARHRLREILFGLGEAPPEMLTGRERHFLALFGFALLTYRFFLFTGIAFLVYHVFFQPLGFFLMIVELAWFIVLPVWSEMKIWYQKRAQIFASRRALVPALCVTVLMLMIFVPWRSSTLLPAIAHAGAHQTFYAPVPSEIIAVHVRDGQQVVRGDVLVDLKSPDLEYRLKKARHELQMLETLRRRAGADPAALLDPRLSDAAIEQARVSVIALEAQAARLSLTAPFTGIIRDFNPALQSGRYIGVDEPLFVMIDPESGTVITGYLADGRTAGLSAETQAEFFTTDRTARLPGLVLRAVSPAGQATLDWPELSSLHGGPIAADKGGDNAIVPRQTLYVVETQSVAATWPITRTGYLEVTTPPRSILSSFANWLGELIRRETHLG